MRKLVISEFLTLDGVMQAPGGVEEDTDGGFAHGGWQMPFGDDVGGAVITEGIMSSDALLLGRRTYEIFAGYWPSAPADEPIAASLNAVAKYVASRTLDEATWQNSTLLTGDVAAAVAELKQQPGNDILVIGSGDLAQTLMKNDLVDEYSFMIHPIVLGSGKRLFRDGNPKAGLELVDHKATTTGVMILTYRPV